MAGNTRPPFLQTVDGFTFVSCVLIFIQAAYSAGFIPATLNFWEKTFQLTASGVAPAVTFYTIFKLCTGIPLTFYLSSGHIPKHLAWQYALIGLTAIMTAIPWLIASTESGKAIPNICYHANSTAPVHPGLAACDHEEASTGLQWIIFIAQMINGFAAACLYSLTPAYIEANASKTKSTRLLSYFLATAPAGVAFGFITGGMFIRTGAWGIPFIISGILLIVVSFFMYRMPKKMPSTDANSLSEEEGGKPGTPATMSMTEFVKDAKEILANPVFLMFALAAGVEAFFITGINNYGPKIFSSYFGMSNGDASIIAGALLVPAAVFGQVVGGVMDSKRSKTLSMTASFTKYIALVAFILVVSASLIQCPTIKPETSSDIKCGAKCGCLKTYDPVCIGHKIHLNGCDAGCDQYDEQTMKYDGCTLCDTVVGDGIKVTHGVCSELICKAKVPFLIVFFVAIFATFMNNPPSQMVMMRVVDERLQANALSVNDFLYRAVGSLPAMPVWAAAIDGTCIVWNYDVCGTMGNCGLYDNERIGTNVMLPLGGVPKLASFLAFLFGSIVLLRKFPDKAQAPYEDIRSQSSEMTNLESADSQSD